MLQSWNALILQTKDKTIKIGNGKNLYAPEKQMEHEGKLTSLPMPSITESPVTMTYMLNYIWCIALVRISISDLHISREKFFFNKNFTFFCNYHMSFHTLHIF